MTTVEAPPPPKHLAPRPSRTPRILATGSTIAIVAAVYLGESGSVRWFVAITLAVTLLLVTLEDEVHGLFAVVGYLIVLGSLRRILTTVQPDLISDPLLLVAPSVIGALAVISIGRGALRPRSALVLLVSAFVAVSALAVLNTVAASVPDNVKGLLFWTVPLLAFPIGRELLSPNDLRRLLRFVAILGTCSCLFGLYQVFVELPPWDQEWFDTSGYSALGINGFDTLHPFGWLPSHTEFAQLAALVVVISGLELLDALRTGQRTVALLAAIGLGASLGSLALSGVRTAQLLALIAIVVIVLASGRVRVSHAVIGITLALALLVGGVRVLHVNEWNDHGIAGLARRSLIVVTDPFDPETSSLRVHANLTRGAFGSLDERPLGAGTGSGTHASGGNPADGAWNAENDLANAALAFGVVGVGLVLSITGLGLHHAWRRARLAPDVVTLAVLGMLVLSLRYWWTGAHYAMAVLVWVGLGFTDRPSRT